MPQKSTAKKPAASRRTTAATPSVGARIVEGLEQALGWSKGEPSTARVNLVRVPDIDIRELRRGMGLSQSQFASRFGLPPATLRNWEQGRARPDAPTRVLLAVIAKHPEAVADALDKAS